MTGTLLLAGLLMSQAATVPQSAATDPGAGNATILARAPSYHRSGWLTTSGPDAQGAYMVWINVADLNLATDSGQHVMNSRVQRAAAMLCDISADRPQIAGYYDRGARECMSSTQSQALGQAAKVREAASRGQSVSMLGFAATASAAR